jgi:hypothetical protein
MQLLDPTTSYGSGKSPKKFCPKGAEEHAHVEHAEHIKSAHGIVEHTDTEGSELYTITDEEDSSLPEDSSLLDAPSDPEGYGAFLENARLESDILDNSALSDSALSDGPLAKSSDPLQTPRPEQRRHSDNPSPTPLSARLTSRDQLDTMEILKPTVYVSTRANHGGSDGHKKVGPQSLLPRSASQATNPATSHPPTYSS